MIVESRRQFLGDLAKFAVVASTAPALLTTDTARGEAVSAPVSLPHYLSVGFTYGGDECRYLNSTLDPNPKVDATTLVNIGERAQDILREDCSDCQTDFIRGAAPLDHDPQTNFQDLYPLYEAASLKGVRVVQAIGKDQPYYPRERLPETIDSDDPDFQEKYLGLVYNFRNMMDKEGLTPYVAAWQLGNEPFNVFGDDDGSSVESVKALQKAVSDTDKPTIINNFFSFGGPGAPWEKIQEIADIAALDFYLQAENNRGTIADLHSSALEYIKASRIPVVGLEEQTRLWKTRWWTFQNFTPDDFLRMFYTTAELLPVLGVWEVDKSYCLAKRGKDTETLRAIMKAMRQKHQWNKEAAKNKVVDLAAYRAFRRDPTSSLAA